MHENLIASWQVLANDAHVRLIVGLDDNWLQPYAPARQAVDDDQADAVAGQGVTIEAALLAEVVQRGRARPVQPERATGASGMPRIPRWPGDDPGECQLPRGHLTGSAGEQATSAGPQGEPDAEAVLTPQPAQPVAARLV